MIWFYLLGILCVALLASNAVNQERLKEEREWRRRLVERNEKLEKEVSLSSTVIIDLNREVSFLKEDIDNANKKLVESWANEIRLQTQINSNKPSNGNYRKVSLT